MSTPLSVGKDTNKRAKIQIIFEIFQAEVSSTLVKYTKNLFTSKQKQEKDPIYGPRIPINKKTAIQTDHEGEPLYLVIWPLQGLWWGGMPSTVGLSPYANIYCPFRASPMGLITYFFFAFPFGVETDDNRKTSRCGVKELS